MTSPAHITALLALAGYLCASGLLFRTLKGHAPPSATRLWWIALPTLALHAACVWFQVFTPAGIQLGVIASATLFALVMAASGSVMSLYRHMGALLAPAYVIAAIAVAMPLLFSDRQAPLTRLPEGLLAHIIVSITAYTLVTLAACQAVLIQVQNRHLKQRHLNRLLGWLPPLQTMENILFDLVLSGWLALSIAIASGIPFVDDLFAQHLAHKTFFTLLAWCVFGTLVIGRWRRGWRGMVAVRWTLTGMVLLMLGYFGTQVVLQMILTR